MNTNRVGTSPRTRDRHSQAFSLSHAFRSAGNRSSIIHSTDTLPTCQERIHYPLFNPQDPRHNPAIADPTWRRQDSQTSSSDSQRPSSWVYDLPMRSLRKARSGILALKAGLLHRSSRQTNKLEDGEPRPQVSRGHGGHFRPGLSSASTQEDMNFGTNLYRTTAPWPSVPGGSNFETMLQVASIPSRVNIATAPAMLESSSCLVHEPVSTRAHHANSVPLTKLPSYSSTYCNAPSSRTSEERNQSIELDISTDREIKSVASYDLTPTTISADWEPITCSASGGGDCINGNKIALGEHRSSTTVIAQEHLTGKTCSDYQTSGNVKPSSVTTGDKSLESDKHMTNRAPRPYTLPDPDALSIIGSNTSQRWNSCYTAPEVVNTLERPQPENNPPSSRDNESPFPERDRSSKVTFAFPGIYHALLEQWMREPSSRCASNTENTSTNGADGAQGRQGSSHDALNSGQKAQVWTGRTSSSQQLELGSTLPSMTIERFNVDNQQGGLVLNAGEAAATTIDAGHTSGQRPITEKEQSRESRHSFGLHIALRSEATEGSESSYRDPWPLSFSQLGRADNRQSLYFFEDCDTAASVCGGSEPSSRYSRDNIASVDITSVTSPSNGDWSSLGSPDNEEIMLSTFWRDEYFMADGKTNSHYPDRGDQPVKIMRRVVGDGSIHSCLGFERFPHCRVQEFSELNSPESLPNSPQVAVPTVFQRDGTGSTDDHYIYVGESGNLC